MLSGLSLQSVKTSLRNDLFLCLVYFAHIYSWTSFTLNWSLSSTVAPVPRLPGLTTYASGPYLESSLYNRT